MAFGHQSKSPDVRVITKKVSPPDQKPRTFSQEIGLVGLALKEHFCHGRSRAQEQCIPWTWARCCRVTCTRFTWDSSCLEPGGAACTMQLDQKRLLHRSWHSAHAPLFIRASGSVQYNCTHSGREHARRNLEKILAHPFTHHLHTSTLPPLHSTPSTPAPVSSPPTTPHATPHPAAS